MHDTHNHTHINRYGRKWRGGGRKKPILDIKLVVLDLLTLVVFVSSVMAFTVPLLVNAIPLHRQWWCDV